MERNGCRTALRFKIIARSLPRVRSLPSATSRLLGCRCSTSSTLATPSNKLSPMRCWARLIMPFSVFPPRSPCSAFQFFRADAKEKELSVLRTDSWGTLWQQLSPADPTAGERKAVGSKPEACILLFSLLGLCSGPILGEPFGKGSPNHS